MQHESLCWCLQIEVVRTHSVVELLTFSLSFMSFFPSFLPSRNISGQGDAFKNRQLFHVVREGKERKRREEREKKKKRKGGKKREREEKERERRKERICR
jgi:hypothetical protein